MIVVGRALVKGEQIESSSLKALGKYANFCVYESLAPSLQSLRDAIDARMGDIALPEGVESVNIEFSLVAINIDPDIEIEKSLVLISETISSKEEGPEAAEELWESYQNISKIEGVECATKEEYVDISGSLFTDCKEW